MDNQKKLIRLEEALLALGVQGRLSSYNLDESQWPERMQQMSKDLLSGKDVSHYSIRDMKELSEFLFMERRMDGDLQPVPEALLATVGRALEADKPAVSEGVVVRLLRSGMELVAGHLQGATLELAPMQATRKSAPEMQEANQRGSRLDLRLPVGRGTLQCSILQISAQEAMVSLSLKNLAGNHQLSLKKEGRLIGSHSGIKSERPVQFDRIAAGNYSIELKGASTANIPFSIV